MSPESASVGTEDKALEEARADNERLRQLLSSVTHDFNNLLGIITGYSELMLRRLRPHDPLRGSAESIKRATEWGIVVTQQALAASRRQRPTPPAASVNDVVSNVTRVFQPALGDRIELRVRLAPDVGRVSVSPGSLGQVIMNLMVNARDAMPAGGRLTIETANVGADVLMSVSDTGIGMDAATRSRLFEPYFTTKEAGKGTGLGLSTVCDVITQHSGRIEVVSAAGCGSTFSVYLPRVEEAVRTVPGSMPPIAATVLVVEDDPEARALLREVLQTEQCSVLEARDGAEALAVGEGHRGPIDLLVAGTIEPATVRRELVERLAMSRPGINVLHLQGPLAEVDRAPGVGAVLSRPFTVAALGQAVRTLLRERLRSDVRGSAGGGGSPGAPVGRTSPSG